MSSKTTNGPRVMVDEVLEHAAGGQHTNRLRFLLRLCCLVAVVGSVNKGSSMLLKTANNTWMRNSEGCGVDWFLFITIPHHYKYHSACSFFTVSCYLLTDGSDWRASRGVSDRFRFACSQKGHNLNRRSLLLERLSFAAASSNSSRQYVHSAQPLQLLLILGR